jgi:hypothetical protein
MSFYVDNSEIIGRKVARGVFTIKNAFLNIGEVERYYTKIPYQ